MTARPSSPRGSRWTLTVARSVLGLGLGLAVAVGAAGCSFRGDVQAAPTSASPAATAGPSSDGTGATPGASTPATPSPSATTAGGAASTPPGGQASTDPATAGGSTTPASGGRPSPTGGGTGSTCRTADLRTTVVFTDAGAGHRFGYVRFTNAGGSACVLSGHPGVSLVAGDDGHQVGAAAARQGTVTATTLAPGAVASAGLSLAQADAYDAATCQPTAVRGFRVYPPDQTASTFVAADGITGCASSSVSLLTVGPVQAGAGS